jgi:iron(III) transport system permease protein
VKVDTLPTSLKARPSFEKIEAWPLSLLLLSLLLATPILVVASSVFFPAGDIWEHLLDTVLTRYVKNSAALMLGVSIGVLALGILPAWLVSAYRFPGRAIFEWALLLPLAIPAYIIAYTYTGMLDVAGPLQSTLRETFDWRYGDYWFPEIRSLGGAIAMLSLVFYPYVYLLCRAAFAEQSGSVMEAARSLGCTPRGAFVRVAMPLARPAIVVGLSIALMETLADYGTVQYFGLSTFTTGIYRTWNGLGSSVGAAQLAALLMCFVFVLVSLESASRRQSQFFNTGSRVRPGARVPLHGVALVGAYMACGLPVLFGFLVPFTQLAVWAGLTAETILTRDFFVYFLNSVTLAVITALAALALALFIAYGKRLYPSRSSTAASRVLGLGYALPGTVVAIGVLLPFAWLDNRLSAFLLARFDTNPGLLLSGTAFILVFAYLVRFLPIAMNTVEAGLCKIKPSMDEAGRSMGLRPTIMLRRIHMPMMRGSLVTALLLVFVDVMKELPATLLLRPFNFNTLAIRTYELANEERLADAAGPALAIVLASLIPVILLSLSLRPSAGALEEADIINKTSNTTGKES